MKKLFILILLLTACSTTRPPEPLQPFIEEIPVCHGQDILGLARQDYEQIANNWSQGECLGVLAATFGPTIKPVATVISKNNVPAVRWHLSFCNHNNQCTPGECQPTDLPCMIKKAKSVNKLHSIYPDTQCYLSPRLEYSEKNKDKVTRWFMAVGEAAPLCILVASPMPGSYVPPNVLLEKHGNSPGIADIVSNDGANYFDSDSVKYNKTGKLINFKWTYRDNLRLSSEKGTALPPKQRPLTNRLGLQDLKQMQLMKEPLPPMPRPGFCANFHTLSNGETWKNHSEDYGAAGDSRSNRPLLISSNKASKLYIYNEEGKNIACAKYYGPYEKLRRFYVGSCSGDHAVDLYRKAKDWIYIKYGNTCIGLPSIRRWGTFR